MRFNRFGRTAGFRHLLRLIREAEAQAGASSLVQGLGNEDFLAPAIPRREFLRAVSAVGLTAGLGPFVQSAWAGPAKKDSLSSQSQHLKNLSPIVILGGGIAGLTAAYALSERGIPCVVYEASGRLGGRMFTHPNFNAENMVCELGGEFIDENHVDLLRLCQELNVPVDQFASGDAGLTENLYYFKNQLYTDQDAIRELIPLVKRLQADALSLKNPEYLKKMDHVSIDQYLQSFRAQTSTWLLDLIRVACTGELGLDADQISAVWVPFILSIENPNQFKLFGESDQGRHIHGGNLVLIQALQAKLQSRGVPLLMDHMLMKIKDHGSRLQMSFVKGSTTVAVKAEKVICTLPFSVLRDVEGIQKLALRPQKKDAIQHMSYATNSKYHLGYSTRVWRTKSKSNGMVYTDLRVQNIWEMSRTQKGKAGILTHFVGGQEGRKLHGGLADAYLACDAQIFPALRTLHDGNQMYWNWSQYPLAKGSYAAPRLGEYTRFGRSAGQPELGGRLHFAGEHTSEEFSGFMNGACESGFRAARQVL